MKASRFQPTSPDPRLRSLLELRDLLETVWLVRYRRTSDLWGQEQIVRSIGRIDTEVLLRGYCPDRNSISTTGAHECDTP